ncbi:UDP-glucose 4-epimerase [Aliivibrio sp. 1S165]|uniref:NAD-dependent epimerase/dehydratase family protein n=1 Tax=unclassified Aliivibrio TaxID=2645654 RepID=UPI00080D8E07|nr:MULTISPECIES: NAD-dependent epimerase/dehydratase family protein [unclassified Aliivibrio]OCH11915.1 UDP-glucose 4-epimerase [Aliivibrio sp. 1S165]OCH35841.1 UDP-glucose 4-epimerase [Aliivibrio sp. 1S175]
MNILLSGATGFIGQQVLLQDKANCIHRCVVRVLNKNNAPCETFVIEDINNNTSWTNAFNNIDAVIHLAGIAHNKSDNLDVIFETNTLGTLKLARDAVANGVTRFIFVSTASIYENKSVFSAQTKSKYDAEVGLKKIAEETGLEVVIVRPTLVYGSNAPGNFGALTRLVNKVSVLPFGLVNNKRDFISVQNLADLLITCASDPKAAGHTFLASDGKAVSIKDFTDAIAKGLNKRLIQLPIPVWLMRLAGKLLGKSVMVEQLVGNLEVDSSNAQEVLGWVPPYTMQQAMHLLLENN